MRTKPIPSPPLLSLRQAAQRLRRGPNYTRGAVDAIGITLTPAGKSLVMTWDDFCKLRTAIEESEKLQVASA